MNDFDVIFKKDFYNKGSGNLIFKYGHCYVANTISSVLVGVRGYDYVLYLFVIDGNFPILGYHNMNEYIYTKQEVRKQKLLKLNEL
jgi:hypothetical protein